MRILFIAPQPYYEERGTVIAVNLLLNALSRRGDRVDLLTLHLGESRQLNGLRIFRIQPRPAPGTVRPGLSIAKLWCDLFILFRSISLVRSNRYDVVYAVEEGAFVAMFLRTFFRTPFVFDMDSSMADQIVEKYPFFSFCRGVLRWLESLPMRRATAVIPMCDALAIRAEKHCLGFVRTLKDVSLVQTGEEPEISESIREGLHLVGPMAMYIGNLEPYQGIDLLIDAFSLAIKKTPDANLIIIGGSDSDIVKYMGKVKKAGLQHTVYLIGRRPVSQLGYFMSQADVLVSPRTKGVNTPMKIYSYLDSGVPVVATNLPTHTQVMTRAVAKICEPDPVSFADALIDLFQKPGKRSLLARNAKELVAREHSEAAFQRQVDSIFTELERRLGIQ